MYLIEKATTLNINLPVNIIKKIPQKGGFSATLNSGAKYINYLPNEPEFNKLVIDFTKELPNIQKLLNISSLPLIWTADFILDEPNTDGSENYRVGEFNCTCVGIKTVVDEISPIIADKINNILDNSDIIIR